MVDQVPDMLLVSKKVKKPKLVIESVAQFIEIAYGKKGKVVPLSKATAKKLTEPPTRHLSSIEEEHQLDLTLIRGSIRERLLELAREDRNLAVARQILATVIGLPVTNRLREVLRSFIRDVLLMHPAFAAEELQAFVKNLPDAIESDHAVELVLNAFHPVEAPGSNKKGSPVVAAEKRRRSIGSCLALWLVVTKKIPAAGVMKMLYPTVWKPAAAKIKREDQRVTRLLDLTDPTKVALACNAYEKYLDEEVARADAATRNSEADARRSRELADDLDEARGRINEHVVRVRELENTLLEERRKSHDQLIHFKDDYERLRGQVLKRLKSEVELLDEGLLALRREPPRVHVMLDHAERAVGVLKNEIRRLESEGLR